MNNVTHHINRCFVQIADLPALFNGQTKLLFSISNGLSNRRLQISPGGGGHENIVHIDQHVGDQFSLFSPPLFVLTHNISIEERHHVLASPL